RRPRGTPRPDPFHHLKGTDQIMLDPNINPEPVRRDVTFTPARIETAELAVEDVSASLEPYGWTLHSSDGSLLVALRPGVPVEEDRLPTDDELPQYLGAARPTDLVNVIAFEEQRRAEFGEVSNFDLATQQPVVKEKQP